MKKLVLSLSLLLSAAMGGVQAQELGMMDVIPNDPEVRQGVLENGATYYIRKNSKDPQRANFHILYKVGAVLEEDRQDGLAHFLEHMAFNGSVNFQGNGLIEYCQSIGIEFGANLNAATGQEQTTYMITGVPITREGIVDSMLLVLHDWAGYISLNGEDIDDERKVIQEEWRMYAGMADQRVGKKSTALMFGDSSIYTKRDIIGEYENLENFTYQDIRDFYAKWYRPDMHAFVIVGDFDPAEMEQKLIKVMSNVPKRTEELNVPTFTVDGNKEPRYGVFTDPELSATTVTLQCRHQPLPKKYNNTLMAEKTGLMNQLATYMLNQRYSEISKQKGAPFLSAYTGLQTWLNPVDIFAMQANAREGESYKAFEAAYTELLRATRGGFAAPELDRAKAMFLAIIEQGYNSRNDHKNDYYVSKYTDNFYDNSAYMAAEMEFELGKKLIEGITLAEVNAQMASLVTPENIVIEANLQNKEGVELPTVEGMQAIYEKVNASEIEPYTEEVITRPLLDASALKGSKVVKTKEGKFGSTIWTLANGIEVYVQPTEFKADEITLNSARLGGTSTIDDLSALYSANIYSSFATMSGLGDFTETDLNKVLSGKVASASTYMGNTTEGYRGSSNIKDMETMFQLLYLNSTAPRFNEEDWSVLIDKIHTQVKSTAKDPMRIFQDSMAMTMAGGNLRALPMSEEQLSQLDFEKMKEEYTKRFSNNYGQKFFINGSIDMAKLQPLVEKYLGSLPVKKTKKPNFNKKNVILPPKGKVDNHFSTPQEEAKTIVVVVNSGDLKDDSLEEMLNLEVAGQVLSNLYLRTIREEAGGVYTVQNQMQVSNSGPIDQYVNFCLFLTDESKYEALIPLVYEGIENITTNGPDKEALAKVINMMEKNYNDSTRQNGAWLTNLMEYYVWDVDNYTNYMEALKKVTPETVKAAAKRAFSQGNVIELIQLP